MLNKEQDRIVAEAADCLALLVDRATNDSIKRKLRNLNDVCRTIVCKAKLRLSVPEVVRHLEARFPEDKISEQTIRNNREKGNPYQTLYRTWEDIAERIFALAAPQIARSGGGIIGVGEIRRIEDPTLRHQVLSLFAQNRSLHNQLNILKRSAGEGAIIVEDAGAEAGGDSITVGEIEAVKDFVDPRKLKHRHLVVTEDAGLKMRDGRPIADAGFVTALSKFLKNQRLV